MESLKYAVQALAQDAATQYSLFPAFVATADELALDFEDGYAPFTEDGGISLWSVDQTSALRELDQLLSELSGDRPEIWLEPGCLHHPAWTTIREKACKVLAAFGWENVPPPEGRAIYVAGPDA